MKSKVTIIVFTLNEIDGIRKTLPKINPHWYDELIIVDGGSTDGTVEYAKENRYNIFKQSKPGMLAAFNESMDKCTGDIVIFFAPDGNSVPGDIPILMRKIRQGYDMSIGSRYYPGAKSEDDDLITSFGNWFFTSLFNILFKTKFHDVLNMFRAYDVEKLKALKLNSKMDSWGTQILARAVRAGYRIVEIPSNEPKRIGGTRKMQPLKNGWWELKMVISEFFNNEKPQASSKRIFKKKIKI